MCCIKQYIIFLSLFFLPATHLTAQDITGTWEGDLGNDQFLQLNVIQNGDKICGFTHDHIKANPRSHCKAYFEGRYDKKRDQWIFTGSSFEENSGGHVLMRLNLVHRVTDGKDILVGLSLHAPPWLRRLFGEEDNPLLLLDDDSVYLTKVSGKPSEILDRMKDCYKKKNTSFDTITKLKIPEITKDSLARVMVPVNPGIDSVAIPKELVKRKNTEQSHLEVNVKTITLNVYDNAVVDGDTISVFYNGKLLLSHQALSEKPIILKVELDEKQTRHEITLFAENLGSIPPNTALIVIYAGNKRYELFASASLEENAVLVFDYVPK